MADVPIYDVSISLWEEVRVGRRTQGPARAAGPPDPLHRTRRDARTGAPAGRGSGPYGQRVVLHRVGDGQPRGHPQDLVHGSGAQPRGRAMCGVSTLLGPVRGSTARACPADQVAGK